MKFLSQFRYAHLTKKLNFLDFVLEKEEKIQKEIEEKQDKINKVRASCTDEYVNTCLWEKWRDLNEEYYIHNKISSDIKRQIEKTKRKINNLY